MSYRAAQLWWNITAGPLPEPVRQEIEGILSPAQSELFCRFQKTDQWHAYRVLQTLVASGQSQPDLLAAALLHDIGKTRVNLSVWDRILIVVIDRIMPEQSNRWGQGDVQSWKRPFVVRQNHAQWGADLARAAGSSTLTIDLIRRHQDPLPDEAATADNDLLRLLQRADDLN
jgi:hypothetical protein